MNENEKKEQAPAMPKQNEVPENEYTEDDSCSLPEWKVSGIFSSHMVLQQEKPITVWGFSCHIGAEVTAVWDEERVVAAVGEDGRFEVTFAPRKATFTPSEMTISSAYGSDTFTDILVGDVWLIGGQSNAELNLDPCLIDTPQIAATFSEQHPFRLFSQTQSFAVECKKFHNTPAKDIINPEWSWKCPGEEASRTFSAIGYYFARLMTEQVNIPFGIVMMCAGGACLRELMPIDLAHERGYTTGANVPVAGYYNTLISPLIGLQFKGQIFFQGESEGIWEYMAHSYGEDLAVFVEDERRRFGFDFPFYNIQLSSYRKECDDYFPYLYWVRSSQYKALDLIPGYYLIVSRDLGALPEDADFAHSPHKYELTKRIAALALAEEYQIGDADQANSPLPVSAVREENKVLITFRCVNGGLRTEDHTPLTGFSFMDDNGKEIPAEAEISSPDTVCVQIPEGTKAKEVHFAMSNMAYMEQGNLCGGSGLPAPAFALPVKEQCKTVCKKEEDV